MAMEVPTYVTLFSLARVPQCGDLIMFHIVFLDFRVFYWMKHQE